MQRRAFLLLLFGFCWAGPVPVPQVFELDSEDSRRVLGSSVVTSVSVIMDLGNGTKAFFADAAGRPMPRPPALSPVGSPVELLSPDRYEFYTFDEFGDLVRRYMTLDQIQSIIASGDGEVRPLPGQLEDYRPSSGTADVGDVIASVQNVLRGAMTASEKPPTRKPPPPRPTKRPETATSPSEKPSSVKPPKPLPPLKTRPLTTIAAETSTPPTVQSTTDNMSSTVLSSTEPRPTTAPVNATTVSEITSASTQSTADSSKTESIDQQSTSTALPTSPVTMISVEITSSEANETSNVNLHTSSNTSISESVDSASVQSTVPAESSLQTEQSSTVVISDSSSTTQTSTSVSNATSYSSSETTTVTSTQLVYNESTTVPAAQSDSLQNETTTKNVSASAESSTSSPQESQTSSSVENTVVSQSTEESSLETSTELSASETRNETTSTEKSETTEYVTEIVSLQTDESSLNASVQNGTDNFEPENNTTSSATEETASTETNSNALSNITSGVTGTSDSENNSGANTTEGEDLSLIMEEILDSTLGSTNQDSVEASSTTPQPENFTSSTTEKPPTRKPRPPRPTKRPGATTSPSEKPSVVKPPKPLPPLQTLKVAIPQYIAETSSETYSTEISILTQPTEDSNKVFNESAVTNATYTVEDIISTTQSYADTTVSEIVTQKSENNNDTRNDVTPSSLMDSFLPQELIDSLSSVMSQVSEDNDEQNLSGLKFSSENISATTLIPEITETTTIQQSVMEKVAFNSSSVMEMDVDGETTTVIIETEQTTVSSDRDSQETETPLLSENENITLSFKDNTKQEENLQIDTTTQEASTSYIVGTQAETTTTLSIDPHESDSIQPTTVSSETSVQESLNISFKSGNANTSADEMSTLAITDQNMEATTTLAAETEEQSNIITTISPLDSNGEGDIKIITTETTSGDIETTTTVPSNSIDYTTIAETEVPSEIDSILKLITKGETRISLIEEPSYTANETQSTVYNNDTSYETTENVGLTEAETTTFSTQPVLQDTEISNVTYDNSSDTFSPESKEDSTTVDTVTSQDEIQTNATAIYSTTTARPENDTLEAEIETTYVSGTKDENVVSQYDASIEESSQTLNTTGNSNTSSFLKNAYNETGVESEGTTTSTSESTTIDQFAQSGNGNQSTAEQVSAVSGNDTSAANVDMDYSNASYPVQVTEVPTENVATTVSPTEQPALKTDLQNGYETAISESDSNTVDVSQNSSSESSVIESGVTIDTTSTEASQVNASTETTKTVASSSSDVSVQETSSTESASSSSTLASTEASASEPANPISLSAPEIAEPGDNALKDGVDAPAPVDLRPSQNEHLGLEATTASLERGVRRFADLCNELALRLWAAVAARGATSARSLVMSPFAVTSLLAMVFLGARGPTSAEMNDLLRLDDMVTFNPHLIFRNITETLVHGRTPGIASVAFVRQLYSDKNKGKILDFYKDRAQQFYDGHVEEANFRVIGDLVRRRTNLLVKRQTRGRVPEFLRGPGVALRPPLAAFSANVLQTDCSDAGMEGRDGEMYFTVTPSPRERRLIPVPAAVWRQGVYAGYDPQIDATVAALGVDSAVSLIFVSPGQQGNVAPGDGLPQLERRLLTPPTWSRLLRSLLPRPGLELQVPRFSHRSLLNATGALQRLGLRDLLTPGRADLRGLDGLGDLHLADVLAATALTTCAGERGHAEAYPARAARLLDAHLSDLPLALRPRQARRPPAPARLRLDKPFFYAVRHNPTGVILHMGRFNPRLQ